MDDVDSTVLRAHFEQSQSQLDEARLALEACERKVAQLQEQANKAKQVEEELNGALKKALQEAQKADALKLAHEEAIETLERAKPHAATLENESKELNALNSQLQSQLATKEAALGNIKAAYDEAMTTLGQQANRAADERRLLLEQHAKELDEAHQTAVAAREEVAHLEGTLAGVKADLDRKNVDLEHARREVADLRNVVAEMERDAASRRTAESSQVDDLREQLREAERSVQAQVSALESKIEVLQRLLSDRDSAAELLQRTADAAERDTRSARKERDEIRRTLGQEVDGLRKQVLGSDSLVKELRTLLGERDQAAERLQREADEAHKQTLQSRKERDRVRIELGQELDNKRGTIAKLQGEANDNQRLLAAVRDEVRKYANDVQTARQSAAKIQKELEAAAASLQRELNAKRDEAVSLQNANKFLERLVYFVMLALPIGAWLERKARL